VLDAYDETRQERVRGVAPFCSSRDA